MIRFYAKDSKMNMCAMCIYKSCKICNKGNPEYGDSLDYENVIACNSFQDAGYGVFPDEYDGIEGVIYANDTREVVYFTLDDYTAISKELEHNILRKRFRVNCPDAGIWDFIIPNLKYPERCFAIQQYGQKKDNDFLQYELEKELKRRK